MRAVTISREAIREWSGNWETCPAKITFHLRLAPHEHSMKRTITIAGSAENLEDDKQVSPTTADSACEETDTSSVAAIRDAELTFGNILGEDNPSPDPSPNKPTQPMKRHILTLASVLYLPILAFAADEGKKNADNTGKNERDRDNKTLTPGDQSAKPEDRKLTQAIRQAVMKDKSLTMTAKNIKIITAEGKVTLRGPVNNAEEKTKIHDLAKAAAGEVPVDNQLEVKAAK